jgi:hypothetical protein
MKPQKRSSKAQSQASAAWQGTGNVESVLFIFGPPGPEELKAKVREWAAAQNKTESEVFFDFTRKRLTDYCTPGDDGTSGLDHLMSRACEHPMKVHEPDVTWYWDTEKRAALRLMGGSIRSTTKPGSIAYLEHKQFVDLLTNAFCLLFQVEEVRAWVVYDEFIPWSQMRGAR